MIVSSVLTPGPPQADGRFYVVEIYTGEDGQEYKYECLVGPDTNLQMVKEERIAVIDRVLAQREAARLLVRGTSVPLTRFEFLDRFTAQERVAVRERAKIDPYTLDFMELMNTSGNVSLARARVGLNYLASVSVLTAARAEAIGAE